MKWLSTLLFSFLVCCMPHTLHSETTHQAWTEVLQKYVQKEAVNFASLKEAGQLELKKYLVSLQKVTPKKYAQFSEEEKIAFWINAYNAYTTDIIVRNYPIESIQLIGKTKGAAFKERFIPISLTGNVTMSLDEVEQYLRKKFNEPRIHFALFCGAASCPVLHSEAFVASRLNEQLEEATREFINDPHRNRYDAKTKTLKLSSIFSWYREDFERNGEKLTDFLSRYLAVDIAPDVQAGKIKLEFVEYQWCLSGRCPLPVIR